MALVRMDLWWDDSVEAVGFPIHMELLPEGKALQQLRDKGYADKYRNMGLPLVLVGVEFSWVARNVVGFDVGAEG